MVGVCKGEGKEVVCEESGKRVGRGERVRE
jgi:hypothetical protein